MLDRAAIREKVAATMCVVEPSLVGVPMTEATSLADLNMDSLRLIELGVLLEEAFGKSVRFDDWIELERARSTNAYTLGSLITFISKTTTVDTCQASISSAS
jgi:acyl carrier protein